MFDAEFSEASFRVVWRNGLFVVVLNWLFFGAIVVGALLEENETVGVYRWPVGAEVFTLEASSAVLSVITIFFFNLVLSGFILVTLTGLALFVLPVGFLLFRAFLWGALLNGLSTPMFLAALPTLVLEGEGYVLAALAGVNLGLSWLKPQWTYRREELSRSEAVEQAFKDCARIYVLVALLLLMAAIVETITLISLY